MAWARVPGNTGPTMAGAAVADGATEGEASGVGDWAAAEPATPAMETAMSVAATMRAYGERMGVFLSGSGCGAG